MTIRKGLPAKNASTDANDTRYDFKNLVVCNANGSPRGGVTSPVGTALVSSTATMNSAVAAFAAVAVRDGGVVFLANDGVVNVLHAAAPTANSRIDVIYAKQNDSSSTVTTPDANDTPVIGIVQGTAAFSPTKPAVPTGGVELGTVLIPAGATATNSSGVVISQTAAFTAGAGGIVPFRTQADMNAWTTAAPNQFAQIFGDGTNNVYTFGGSSWGRFPDVPSFSDRGTAPSNQVITGANAWQDVSSVSVTKTTTAGDVEIEWDTVALNVSGSASYYEILYRIVFDGSADANAVGPALTLSLPGVASLNPKYVARNRFRQTVAAGSHTWKLQHRCGAATVVATSLASLKVTAL